ncbi:MAG TPA: hypothetical protein ENN07_03850 [candidate division Zixibacteria bacterium]|nr:hypothetical protein [candidate division Zixibacteria bacterium]
MIELKPTEELAPRIAIDEDKKVLIVNGPNPLEGHLRPDFRSWAELSGIDGESFDAVFAWFTEPDASRAKVIVEESARIVAPGGDLWLVVPKRNSLEKKFTSGVSEDFVLPMALEKGFTRKKSVGFGPHLSGIRLLKNA